jgi:hypothetical protein
MNLLSYFIPVINTITLKLIAIYYTSAMVENYKLHSAEVPASRAAIIATEDNDGIVEIDDIGDSNLVRVEFKDKVPHAADTLIRHQNFMIEVKQKTHKGVRIFK